MYYSGSARGSAADGLGEFLADFARIKLGVTAAAGSALSLGFTKSPIQGLAAVASRAYAEQLPAGGFKKFLHLVFGEWRREIDLRLLGILRHTRSFLSTTA